MRMTSAINLLLGAAVFLASIGFTAAQSRSETKTTNGKPNVILIMTDDQGYGDLACHGNPDVQTPEMDWARSP